MTSRAAELNLDTEVHAKSEDLERLVTMADWGPNTFRPLLD